MRPILVTTTSFALWLTAVGTVSADVYIRAPFVRVQVGDGVRVRAPFVNLNLPSGSRLHVVPGVEVLPPGFDAPPPQAEPIPLPPKKTSGAQSTETMPRANGKPKPADDAPPAPAPGGLERVLTPDQFVRSFQPKAGNYEVTLLNPVNNQATAVRFSLPEGAPRRVRVSGNQIEFDYGPRQYVRIRFDRDGAEVLSRIP